MEPNGFTERGSTHKDNYRNARERRNWILNTEFKGVPCFFSLSDGDTYKGYSRSIY
jgi:hypothetical protein